MHNNNEYDMLYYYLYKLVKCYHLNSFGDGFFTLSSYAECAALKVKSWKQRAQTKTDAPEQDDKQQTFKNDVAPHLWMHY